MGDGTEKNPYTRKDVLRLIKKTGGKAEGLDLSGKHFERDIDLKGFDLEGIILKKADLRFAHLEGADLSFAHLEEANLWYADLGKAYLQLSHLEGAYLNRANLKGANSAHAQLKRADLSEANLEGTDLVDANLEGVALWSTHLGGADLSFACLKRANLVGVEFPRDTKLEEVDWGNYILGGEKKGTFGFASDTYRRLKTWHTEHGLYDIAGRFFYREMEAKRKFLSWRKKPQLKLWNWILRMLCGYGEKPERVIISAATIVFGLAIAYFLWGSFSSSSFADTLYYSVASFTALGYGNWAPQPTGWAKGVGAAEAVLGVSMMALFLVTFTRKMIR